MKQTFKLFMVKEKPYLTADEPISVGDMAIVTVGDFYPSVVECKNDEQIKLIQESKLSMTKRHKVIMKPEKIDLDDETIRAFGNGDGFIIVEVEDGKIKVVNNNEEI
jgi:hypothetical protein